MTILALLISALLFGGMVIYSFGFAAFVFTALPAETAGPLIRRAFPHYYLFVIITGAIAAALLIPLDVLAAGLMAAIALVTVPTRQMLMPAINAARDVGDKARFGRLHGVSVAINMVQIVAAGYVLSRFV
jgi:hypothetical protein